MGELIATAANTDADLTTIAFTHLARLSLIILVIPSLISIVFVHLCQQGYFLLNMCPKERIFEV